MPLINNSTRYFSEISQQFISGPLCHPTFVGFRYIFYSSHSSGAGAPAQWTTICRPLSVGFRLRLRLRRDRLISARQWLAGRLTSALQLNYHLADSAEPNFYMRALASLIQKPGRAKRKIAGWWSCVAAEPPVTKIKKIGTPL